MPSFVPQRYEQWLQQMIAVVVSRTDLSDITDASAVKHVLAATARGLDEASFQMLNLRDAWSLDTAQADDLDARAREIAPSLLVRAQASAATGNVTFTRALTVGTINIPVGTLVQTAAGLVFATTTAASILDTSASSGNVAAIAQAAGAAGNVTVGTIVKFVNKPVGVDAVTNNANFVNGADQETDSAFRDRIRLYRSTLSRSTPNALRFAAEQIVLPTGQRVAFAHVLEDVANRGEVTLYIDDGAGGAETVAVIATENITEALGGPANGGDSAVGGETRLFTNQKPIKVGPDPFTLSSDSRGALTRGAEYTLDETNGLLVFTPPLIAGEVITVAPYTHFTGLIQETQKVIDGDANDRANYPGHRAAGTRVAILTPQILVQEVVATVTVAEGFADSAVLAAIQDALLDYINNLGISGDVLRAKIIDRIMGVAGVYNVAVVSPATDITINDDQLPRITSGNITLS